MDSYERQQDIKWMHEMLREQHERVSSSREEAEKTLTELGILHLFVPIKKRKSKPNRKLNPAGK